MTGGPGSFCLNLRLFCVVDCLGFVFCGCVGDWADGCDDEDSDGDMTLKLAAADLLPLLFDNIESLLLLLLLIDFRCSLGDISDSSFGSEGLVGVAAEFFDLVMAFNALCTFGASN